MLKSILMVTMLVTNLSVTEDAYEEYLGYKVVEQGIVSDSLATIWNAEEMIDHPYTIMQPESGAEVYLRFIEDKQTTNYKPVGTHGWNSTEILVEDPDNLAKEYFGDQGMLGYVANVQRKEIREGIACVKHQNMSGSDMGDDHKEYFAGEAALKAAGKDNTMNQF